MLTQLALACSLAVSTALFALGLALAGAAACLAGQPRLDEWGDRLIRLSGKLLGITAAAALVWSVLAFVA